MGLVTREAVETALRQYTDPHLNQDPVSAGCLREVDIQGGKVRVRLQLGYAAGLFKSGWAQLLQMALENLDGVDSVSVQVDCVIEAHQGQAQVPPGSVLYVFSDGVFEVQTPEGRPWRLGDFVPLLTQAPQPGLTEPERLVAAVRQQARPGPPEDDVSMLSVTFLS